MISAFSFVKEYFFITSLSISSGTNKFAAKAFGDEVLFKNIHKFSKEFALNSGNSEQLTDQL